MALTIYQQIAEAIDKAKKIFIALPKNPSGDALGCAFALSEILKFQNKKIAIAAEGDFTFYQELLNIQEIKNNIYPTRILVISVSNSQNLAKFYWQKELPCSDISTVALSDLPRSSNISGLAGRPEKINIYLAPQKGVLRPEDVSVYQGNFEYDLIITFSASDLESLGDIYARNASFFHETPIINIDYKLSNEKFGEINLIASTKSSTAEILFSLLEKNYSYLFNLPKPQTNIAKPATLIKEKTEFNWPLAATCLILGIMAETKNFKTATVSPQTLETAAKLLSLKADREKIVKTLYYNKPVKIMNLLGRALARLKIYSPENIFISLLSREDFIKSNTASLNLPTIFNEMILTLDQSAILIMLAQDESWIHIYIKKPSQRDLDLEKIFWQKKPQKITADIIYFKTPGEKILKAESEVVALLKT